MSSSINRMFTVKTYKKTLKNGLKLESQLNHTVLKKRRSKIPENTELLSSLLRTLNIIIQGEGDIEIIESCG